MKKRGRKSGSSSFVQVSLSELNNVLKSGAKVIVWNRYASMLGLEGKPVEAKYDVLIAAVNGGKTEFEIDEFDSPGAEQSLEKEFRPEKISQDHLQEDLVQKPSVALEIF